MKNWTTLKKLIWLKATILSGVAAIVKTVTGNAPLTLANAIARAIRSLTQTGLCTQSTTPTPDAPVDIMCNNGALRYGALGANLCDPSAANTVLEYYINKADGEVKPSPPNFMFANYIPVDGGKTYVAYGRAKSGNDLSDYNRVAWYDSNKNWLSGADYTQNRIAVVTAPENAAYARFSCNPSGTTTTTVTQELVDSYNWMFAEGTAEITPFVPFEGGIYTDGTDEVLTVLANQNTDPTIVKATLASGETEVRYNSSSSCIVAPIKPNTVYSIGFLTKPTGGSIFRVVTTKGLVSSGAQSIASIAYNLDMNNYATKTLNSGNEAAWMYVQLSNTMSAESFASIIIQEGNAIMPPQTVTDVPMLLSVNDYKDESEIISGGVTHKVGIKVLDGTEDGWSQATTTQGVLRFYLPFDGAATPTGARTQVASTHFAYAAQGQDLGIAFLSVQTRVYFIPTDQTIDTVDEWTAWLAAQYAAGTPVIVLYPLAEATTESVAGQSLSTAAGTNVVSVNAEVSPVALECEYYATE